MDSVLESTRAKEAALKQETTQQLDAFRRQQDEAERVARLAGNNEGDTTAEEEHWVSAGRKRKKGKDKESLMGIKIRRKSSTGEKAAPEPGSKAHSGSPDDTHTQAANSTTPKATSQEPTAEVVAKTVSPRPKAEIDVAGSANGKGTQTQKLKATPVALGLGAYSSDEDD